MAHTSSKKYATFVVFAVSCFDPERGSDMFLLNVSRLPTHYTVIYYAMYVR
jgi:hypothetical protein